MIGESAADDGFLFISAASSLKYAAAGMLFT